MLSWISLAIAYRIPPYPTPQSYSVNVFAQYLSAFGEFMRRPFVFPPLVLVGPHIRYLEPSVQSCTVFVVDVFHSTFSLLALYHFTS